MKGEKGGAKIVPVLVGLMLALYGLLGHAGVCAHKINSLEGEWAEYRRGEFIVQYTLTGKHALRGLADTEGIGVPDVVADATLQLVAMREMLTVLGFQLPLESARYRGRGASHILVRFRNLQRLNGRAFDEVRRLPSGECVLIIELTANYRSGNLTPAHELFHQVQNGYTPFKRPWFYEGTARWAETILGNPAVTPRMPPEDEVDLRALWSQSYAAASVWHGLIERCDHHSAAVTVPGHLRALRYRNGQPVLSDHMVPGYRYIRQALERLDELAERATLKKGLKRYRWSEKMQRDPRYDVEIWDTVRAAGACAMKAEGFDIYRSATSQP